MENIEQVPTIMGDVVLNTSDLALGLQYQHAACPTLGSSCALEGVERIVLAGTPLVVSSKHRVSLMHQIGFQNFVNTLPDGDASRPYWPCSWWRT